MVVINEGMVGVEVFPGFRLPVAPALGQMLFESLEQRTEPEGLHILQGTVARMVHDHIHDHPDASLMGFLNQGTEFLPGTEVGIRDGEVQGVIAW